MKCPKCNKEIKEKGADTSYSQKTGKQYKRTVYVCRKDDIWIRLEIPNGKKISKAAMAILKKKLK